MPPKNSLLPFIDRRYNDQKRNKKLFQKLKYFFTPLGVLLLGIILGISVALPMMKDAIVTAVEDISKLLGDTHVDMGHVWSSLGTAVRALDWNDPFQALGTMFSEDWLTKTVQACFDGIFGVETAEYTAQYVDVIGGLFRQYYWQSSCLSLSWRSVLFAAFFLFGI